MKTELGKIAHVSFGMGGYQECMFGLTLGFESRGGSIGTFIGGWPYEQGEATPESRDAQFIEMIKKVMDTMKKAKVEDVVDLVGTPVELTLDGNMLKDWRILEEVI